MGNAPTTAHKDQPRDRKGQWGHKPVADTPSHGGMSLNSDPDGGEPLGGGQTPGAAPVDSGRGGGDDSVTLYLNEIGRVDRLDREQEERIANRIRRSMAASVSLASGGQIGAGARRRLERLVRDGDQAREEMVKANLRLVVSVAKRYKSRDMGLLDLVQEGNLGLMRAVERFDPSKGWKFSTYAVWWIRQSIVRAISSQARTIRVPRHMASDMNRVGRARRRMHQELGREPTVAELAAGVDLPAERVREILRVSLNTLSLDSPAGDTGESSLGDLIEDRDAETPDDAAARRMLAGAVGDALHGFSQPEQDVIRLRFGFDDGRPRTLEEVGRAFGVTRGRIRQIEARAMAKLRQTGRSETLRDYLE